MRNSWYKKGLVFGIIFLFIGVAVAPSTAVEIPEKVDVSLVNDTSKEDCDCQTVDKVSFVELKRTLDKLGNNTWNLELLSFNFLKTKGKVWEIQNIKNIDDRLICYILYFFGTRFDSLSDFWLDLALKYLNEGKLFIYFGIYVIGWIFWELSFHLYRYGRDIDCWE